MASYGYALYGYSAYGLTVDPIGSNIGGLIRFSDNGSTPMILRVQTDDGVQVLRTALNDMDINILRSQPDEFAAVIRVETAFDLSAERTPLEDQVLTIHRTYADGRIAIVRHKGQGQLSIEPEK